MRKVGPHFSYTLWVCLVVFSSLRTHAFQNHLPSLTTLTSKPAPGEALRCDSIARTNARSTAHVVSSNEEEDAFSSSYHLIWSRGAWKKFLAGMVFWPLATKIVARTTESAFISSSSSVLLPLLASSCCIVQVTVQTLFAGVGCWGFNTILGPSRPYFLSLWVVWQGSQKARLSARPSGWHLASWLVQGVIVFLPELLYLWNTRSSRPAKNSPDTQLPLKIAVELDIPTMGCVACVNKIQSTLKNDDNKVFVSAWLLPPSMEKEKRGGRATVQFSAANQGQVDALVNDMIQQVEEKAGFVPCLVRSVDITQPQEEKLDSHSTS